MSHRPPQVIRCQHPGRYSWLAGKRRQIEQARNDAKIAAVVERVKKQRQG